MKKFFTVLFSIIISLNIFASIVTKNEAVQIANQFIDNYNLNINYFTINDLAYTELSNNTPVFYIFNKEDKGFVIVSAQDFTIPVLGYSDKNSFDVSIPINIRGMFDEYTNEAIYGISNNFISNDEIKKTRDDILNNKVKNSRSVDPLLGEIKWNQNPYYNDSCPYDPSYGWICPVGCVATAMAQIMRYWEYPDKGTGSYSYVHNQYGEQYANFEVDYIWENMPKQTLYSPNAACAQISYHCAVSVNMNFSPYGSGASQEKVPMSLIKYFGYSFDAKNEMKSNYTNEEWSILLKSELDDGRPVQYAGSASDGSGGHSFVCDGYDGEYFHFNWGWGGSSDGYFSLSSLTPSYWDEGYTYGQRMVMGIRPPEEGEEGILPPVNLKTTEITSNSAFLSWDVTTEGSFYIINMKKETDENWTIYSVNDNYTEMFNLEPNTTYQWRVKSTKFSFESRFSDIVTFKTLNGSNIDYNKDDITIYPNPTSNFVNINGIDNIEKVIIYNSLGKIVSQEYTNTIDVSLYPSGIYIFNIITQNKTYNQKVIIR